MADEFKGPFVLAGKSFNNAGWPTWLFTPEPYVHRSQAGAEQEARKLARRLDREFSVFGLVSTVIPVMEVEKTHAVCADQLAGAIALSMQAHNMHMSIESARFHVEQALKSLEQK